MGRKTGKSRKKYWKSAELAAKTDEIIEQHNSHKLKVEIGQKKDEELFKVDTSKLWVGNQGTYHVKSIKPMLVAPRSEISEWEHKNERFEKKKKFTADDIRSEDAEAFRIYDFSKNLWTDGLKVYSKKRARVKPNANEHILLPSGGLSYNPTFKEHQELLSQALVAEELEEKERLKVKEFWESIPRVTHEEKEVAVLEGVENFYFKQKLCNEGEESNAGSTVPESSVIVANPPMSNRKLKMTPKQRDQLKLKQNVKSEEQNLMRKEKIKRAKENEALHAKSIIKKLVKVEKIKALKFEARQARKNDPKRMRVIGRTPPDKLKTPFKLTEELPASLRSLVPESDVLASERIASLIKRNVIEPLPLTRAKTTARERYIEKRRRKKNVKILFHRNNQPPVESL